MFEDAIPREQFSDEVGEHASAAFGALVRNVEAAAAAGRIEAADPTRGRAADLERAARRRRPGTQGPGADAGRRDDLPGNRRHGAPRPGGLTGWSMIVVTLCCYTVKINHDHGTYRGAVSRCGLACPGPARGPEQARPPRPGPGSHRSPRPRRPSCRRTAELPPALAAAPPGAAAPVIGVTLAGAALGSRTSPQSRHSTSPSLRTRCMLEQTGHRSSSADQSTDDWQAGQISTWRSARTPRFQGLSPRSGSTCRAPHR